METQSLHSKESQETLMSLLQLDPTPIDSPSERPSVNTDKDLPPLPEGTLDDSDSKSPSPTSTSTGTTGVGLSGTGHGSIYYCGLQPRRRPFSPELKVVKAFTNQVSPGLVTRIQRYSSYAFSFFASLHLATTSLIPLAARSVPASESYLLLAREIYQTTLSEPLLVGLPIIAHVGSGIALRFARRAQNIRRYGRQHHVQPSKLTIRNLGVSAGWPTTSFIAISGYGFSAILAAHIFMNRGLPLMVEGDSANIGLAYVAHGFARHPWTSWVSYAALLGLGCGHMVWGWAKWFGLAQKAGWKPDRVTGNVAFDKAALRKRRRALLGLNAVALGATAIWAAGGLGVVALGGETLGWVGKLYDGLLAQIPGFA